MTPKNKAQEFFMKFRSIPPQSHCTGIDDAEAKECVKVLISILIKEQEGLRDRTGKYEVGDLYYREILKHVDKCKVR
jgi:hypothetical protein